LNHWRFLRLSKWYVCGGYAVGDAHQTVDGRSVAWLVGGGEMGERIRAFDWSKTEIGPPETWSPALRMMVQLLLANRFPLLLWWGPQYVSIYNDAYRPVLGTKHPWGLGRPLSECWSEIWDVLKPLVDRPFKGGPATWNEDIELEINRNGFLEETHFTVAYSPVPDETALGGIGGVLATVHEITEKVIGERRVTALRDLGLGTPEAKSAEDACVVAAAVLRKHAKDVPFALLYLITPDCKQARLTSATGTKPGEHLVPSVIELDASHERWPLSDVARTQGMRVVENLQSRFGNAVPRGPWSDPPREAVVLPIRSSLAHQVAGFLIAGVSSRLKLDHLYQGFFELVATQISTTVTNARAYEEERKRAEALAEIDRAKTAFFSNVSHEFRTPLTLMLGPLEETLASSKELAPADREQLETVQRNSLRLLKLVNTLLDFSRIEAGRVQAVYNPTDLASFTAELASVFRSATEKAGIKLVVDCPPLSEPAYVDREMWEKIVLNLISNAFKFTFHGEIEVRLRESTDRVQLTVRDTGTGIPHDELPKLFERFHRVTGAHGRTHEGSGIGLALVQELAKLHGGSVAVESIYGQGSTFRVTIPQGRGHLPDAQIGAARTQVSTTIGATPFVDEALRWLPDAGPADGQIIRDIDVASDAVESPEERARIVLADDNADMRDYVRRLLAARYEVEAVADGEAAIAAIGRSRPDLVLSDIMMPGLDGVELLARLRADPQTSTLPIVLLSARAGEESRIAGMQAGADDYLIKPFSARELLARVESHMKMARFRRDAIDTLRESEARFRNMADNAPFMIWVTEADATCTFLSRSWYDFTGQTSETSLGFGWLDAIHPDDRAAVRSAFLTANARCEAFRLEYRLRQHDAEYRWALNAAAPRFGEQGEFLGYIGSVIDITERKHAEETQQLLVGELNHRIKNTLASVQAIVQHTLRRTKDPAEFVGSFTGRIQSLARVHSLLTTATWQGADLRELIDDQLLQGSIDETRVTTRGPPVHLEAEMTLHLALVLHELGTNAHKYGALSTPSGRVTIGWTVEGGSLRLRWEERGGPPVTSPTGRGFGTTLIEQSAKGEGGNARMSVRTDGILWEITLPLPKSIAADARKSRAPEVISSVLASQRTHVAKRTPARLAGRRFLVVEDEPLVALDIAAGLQEAGAEVVASTGSAKEALHTIESKMLDAALLDGNLHGRPVDEIAAALTRRKVPFLFVTGYGRASLPQTFNHAAVLPKPFSQQQLIEAAARLLEWRGDVVRLANN
jgi:PAS domain S-box-containing protein